jgi:hypothetical protein
MYYQMARKLGLESAGYFEHSQGVEMVGNAVQLDLTVVEISGGATVSVGLQTGNDLENWVIFGSGVTPTSIGHYSYVWTGVASRYVRLIYTLSTGRAVLAAGIETSDQ